MDRTSHQTTALIVVTTSSFATAFIGSAVNLAIPKIGAEFAAGAFMLSWVVTGFTLGSAAFLLPFGRLGDIIGRKKVFLSGLSLFSCISIAAGFSTGIMPLITLRLLQGIAGSMIFSTATAILTSAYPPEKRGKALGLTTAATYIGLSLGPALGGFLSATLGWRSIFFLVGASCLMTAGYAAVKLSGEWTGAKGEKFDKPGAALYVAAMICLVYGLSSVASIGVARYVAAAGAVLGVLFVKWERRAQAPLLQLSIFSNNRGFVYSNLAAMINYSATSALSFMLSLYLQIALGYGPEISGMILLAQPVVMAAFSPFAGALSDRVEPRILTSLGMGLTGVGLFVFVFVGRATPLWVIAGTLALIGVGFGLFSSPNTNAIMACCDRSFYGVAASIISTMRTAGQAISMAIVTVLIALMVGNVKLGPENADALMRAFRLAFFIFTVLCGVGTLASMARGNITTGKAGTTSR